jgi:hypothetical protein
MWQEKKQTYPWLCCADGLLGCEYCRDAQSLRIFAHSGMALSTQWCSCEIDDGGNIKKSTRLNSLRNKIHKHVTSAAHLAACEIRKNKQEGLLEKQLGKQTVRSEQCTENVFRTVYYLAKCNRPFSDHEQLVDLQQQNGVDLGCYTSQSVYSDHHIRHVYSP